MSRHATVTVPASSGNIGPGFDVLGLALNFRNELHVSALKKSAVASVIRIVGEGESSLPTDRSNAISATMERLFARAKTPMPKLDIVCVNRIPLARGLGSSSAAYLSALLAANRLLGDRYGDDEILDLATELEGHPDNVAPALYGGVRASGVFGGRVITSMLPSPRLKMVVAIPRFELSTKKARKVLPKKIPMKDAISNLSSVALLPLAFTSAPKFLGYLLNDRWHEPYRAKLIPGFYEVKKAALKAGAFGVTLSGAGPTMLSFVDGKSAGRVASAMAGAFAKAGVASKTMQLEIDKKGATVQ